MTHEKNMIDYLDWIKGVFLDKQTTLDKIYEKRDFNKSTPKLGDYVPTNEKGEVMERAVVLDSVWSFPSGKSCGRRNYHDYIEEYQSALDRVIWKGWEIEQRGSYKTLQRIDEVIAECYNDSTKWDWYGVESYENLITSGVKLERIQRK